MSIATQVKAKSTAASTANPITLGITIDTSTVVVASILSQPNVARTGGDPTFNGVTMSQASTRLGVEAIGVETWYLLNDDITTGISTLSVPNSGNKTLFLTLSVYNTTLPARYLGATDASGSGTSTSVTTTDTDANLVVDIMVSDSDTVATANSHTLLYHEDLGSQVFSTQ